MKSLQKKLALISRRVLSLGVFAILSAFFVLFPTLASAQYSPYYQNYYYDGYPNGYPRYETYYPDIYLSNPYYQSPAIGGYPAGYYIVAGANARDNIAPSASLASAVPRNNTGNSAAIGGVTTGTLPANQTTTTGTPVVPGGLPNAGLGGATIRAIGMPIIFSLIIIGLFLIIMTFEKRRLREDNS